MNQNLSVNPDGVKSLSDLQNQVAAAVSQLVGAAPDAEAAETAYGTISSAFTSAMGQVLPSRNGTLQATSTSSETIGRLLQAAAAAYEQGDQANAEKLRAAADALAGPNGTAAAGSQPAGAGTQGAGAGGGGAEMAGQMVSQVGQQLGQFAQGMAQSAQGLAQGLSQLPQQVMQGVQGIVESATKGGESGGQDGAGDGVEDGSREGAKDDEARAKEKGAAPDGEHAPEQRDEPASPAPAHGAQPGRPTEQGPAPDSPPATPRREPAQTRPQQSSL